MQNLRKMWMAALFLVCAVGSAQAADAAPYKAAAKEVIGLMDGLTAILAGIKDEATAKAAGEKLNAEVAKINALKEKLSKMEEPDEATDKALEAEFKKPMEDAAAKFGKEVERVMQIQGAAAALEAPMTAVGQAMTELGKEMEGE